MGAVAAQGSVEHTSPMPPTLRQLQQTGAFKKYLPDVFAPKTHYKRALRTLGEVKADYTVKNLRNQNRKLTAQSLDAIMKGLTKVFAHESFLHFLFRVHG